MNETVKAKLAISIDKPTNGNYAISLPNKIFEYMDAAVPVLVSPLQEIKPIIENYKTGVFIRSYDPVELAKQIEELLSDCSQLDSIAETSVGVSTTQILPELLRLSDLQSSQGSFS